MPPSPPSSPGLSYSDLAIATADTGRGRRAQLRLTQHGHDLLTTAAEIATASTSHG